MGACETAADGVTHAIPSAAGVQGRVLGVGAIAACGGYIDAERVAAPVDPAAEDCAACMAGVAKLGGTIITPEVD